MTDPALISARPLPRSKVAKHFSLLLRHRPVMRVSARVTGSHTPHTLPTATALDR